MRTAAMNECSEFEVYYQPIIDTKDQKNVCCGAEALVRWNSSVMGFVSPNDFIPLAEYLGLINPIGEYVLRQAVKRCKYWNDMGHPNYKVNVNLSVVQLLQNDIVKKIKSAIEDSHINPANLTLEVTESLAINDMVRMKKILSEIKSLGVKVALDDFGTGQSNLNYIVEMPVQIVKFDGVMTQAYFSSQKGRFVMNAAMHMIQDMKLGIVSEGIETQEQLLQLLNDLGIRSTQATISRDIKQLHLVKEPTGQGRYRYAVSVQKTKLNFADKLRTIFRESVVSVEAAQNIVVLKTIEGMAQGAAFALDNMGDTDIVGTLAGDDTIFLVFHDTIQALDFCEQVKQMLR